MAILRYKDITKMDVKERQEKLSDLRTQLIKGSVTANKQNAKTKEIKKAIARILTFGKNTKEVKK